MTTSTNVTTDLCSLSATELAAAIAAKSVSSVEAVEAHLEHIERVNPEINAIPILDHEGALSGAREADAALARGERRGQLYGVPFTLKDAHAVAGMRSTIGFPPFDHVPHYDGTVAARLKSEGAILLGKTNVPTLLADHQTANPIFGRTNNPIDVSRTPGGSSGGAAAAIASKMTPFDVGTDLASSIRLPAHFCGIFGLKPTEHRVSFHGVFPIPGDPPRAVRALSCVGPLARMLSDIALLFSIISGPDGLDSDVVPLPADTRSERSEKDLRVAFAPSIDDLPVAEEIRALVERVARSLEERCAIVERAKLPSIGVEQQVRGLGDLIGMMTGAFGPDGDSDIKLGAYLRALDARDRVITLWETFFESWDVLITPPAMTTAFPHSEPAPQLLTAYGDLFNYSGHPAIVVPCSVDSNGLPMGVQVVAARNREANLFRAAGLLTA